MNYGSLPLHPSEQINQPSKTYQAVVRGEANFPASWTWSTTNKVTFICHSHGGTTVRYLLYLLSGAAPPDLPQFPTEDEQDRAKAVITLGTPHQGSTITSLIQVTSPTPSNSSITPGLSDRTSNISSKLIPIAMQSLTLSRHVPLPLAKPVSTT